MSEKILNLNLESWGIKIKPQTLQTAKTLFSSIAEELVSLSENDEGCLIVVAVKYSEFLDLFLISNKCTLKNLLLAGIGIHISSQLAQQIQTDRKPTEKPNNKQACTNL